MLKVEILSEEVLTEWSEAKGRNFYHQEAAVWTGAPYPLVVRLSLRSEEDAYSKGEYRLASTAFRVGRFGGLELDPYGIRLVPVNEALKKVS